ncbi:MAG TPA: DUF1570 domain-containing protein [Tepidisphaeraceae bacterium]
MRWVRCYILACLLLSAATIAAIPINLPAYTTPYYTIYTDLSKDDAREAAIRMTKMAEEYHDRTRGFSGAITQRMPFYLYKDPEEFYASGAPRGSAGYFDGQELVAMAGDLGPRTWQVVQHEGFHQFAHQVIRGTLPIWLDEGLAEYFGEAVFTGDGFVSGVIPPWRLKRIRETLAAGKFKPIDEMMNLSHEQWNSELAVVNYDQGWSMVHFLAHGENGRYQRPFVAFMIELGRNQPWKRAWADTFGDTQGFEQHWRTYWSNLPDNPTADLYAKAETQTLTSFLARAVSQHEKFDSFDDFKTAAADGKLVANSDDWLPPGLLSEALKHVDDFVQNGYSFEMLSSGKGLPQLMCTMPDGRKVMGKFTLRGNRVGTIDAEIVSK